MPHIKDTSTPVSVAICATKPVGIEDLKSEIQKKVRSEATSVSINGESDLVDVCLFCHEQDLDSFKPLYNHLKFSEMFKVKLPLRDAQSFQNHKQLLQASDAVLLYYGNAGEDWLENIWRLIQRHLSAGRTKPVLAKAIYAGSPRTPEKDLLDSEDPLIIKNYGGFSPNSLAPFIEKIKAAKGGPR